MNFFIILCYHLFSYIFFLKGLQNQRLKKTHLKKFSDFRGAYNLKYTHIFYISFIPKQRYDATSSVFHSNVPLSSVMYPRGVFAFGMETEPGFIYM